MQLKPLEELSRVANSGIPVPVGSIGPLIRLLSQKTAICSINYVNTESLRRFVYAFNEEIFY